MIPFFVLFFFFFFFFFILDLSFRLGVGRCHCIPILCIIPFLLIVPWC